MDEVVVAGRALRLATYGVSKIVDVFDGDARLGWLHPLDGGYGLEVYVPSGRYVGSRQERSGALELLLGSAG